jgi:hypothetical protein
MKRGMRTEVLSEAGNVVSRIQLAPSHGRHLSCSEVPIQCSRNLTSKPCHGELQRRIGDVIDNVVSQMHH